MRPFLSFLVLLLCFPVVAQKHVEYQLETGNLEKIILSSDEIYRIELRAIRGDLIKIYTDAEGEYFDEIYLDVETRNNILFIGSKFPKLLQSGYDKLSAHKVFSMEVLIEIPENMIVEINSNIASTFISGKYKEILIQLKEGSCYLKDFEGDAVINTYDGNILGTANNINPEASSRHGEVEVPKNNEGIHKMVLTSINGDIKVFETK